MACGGYSKAVCVPHFLLAQSRAVAVFSGSEPGGPPPGSAAHHVRLHRQTELVTAKLQFGVWNKKKNNNIKSCSVYIYTRSTECWFKSVQIRLSWAGCSVSDMACREERPQPGFIHDGIPVSFNILQIFACQVSKMWKKNGAQTKYDHIISIWTVGEQCVICCDGALLDVWHVHSDCVWCPAASGQVRNWKWKQKRL